jgi:DNA-binding CsgD family transcriptional regulator
MLIGRGAERAAVRGALEDARRGRSSVLVLTGEAGIGKSALLADAREQAAGMLVLSVAGIESEADLAFGALHALLPPALPHLDRIPDRQRAALRAALALEGSEAPDRLAAYAGTLSLLAEAAAEQPLLVLVDDAHWLDRASAEAIGFAARRIAGEEIAMLVGVREGERSSFDAGGLPVRRIPPLGRDDSLALLRERHGGGLEPSVAAALAEVSGGNPLALVELPAALSPGQRSGAEPLEELPVAERIERAFLRRVGALPEPTRRSLLVAAAGAGLPLAAIRSAGGDALEPAEADGLVDLGRGTVVFRHPLARAAVYHAASPARRRAVHRALAAALEDAPDERAWQLAAAAEGPDEEAAAVLEATAERAVRRGGFAAQSRALERAAQLSADDETRARRLHAASRAAYWAGTVRRAVSLAQEALPLARDPLVRADLRHQLAVIADFAVELHPEAPTTETLEREAAAVEPLDAERAIALLGVVHQRRRMRLEPAATVDVAERRLALAERLGGERLIRSRQDLVQGLVLAGRAREASALQDEILHARARDESPPMYASQAAEPLLWLERFDELRTLLARTLERSREEGNVVRLAFDLTNIGSLELRTARLDAADAAASEALLLAEQSGIEYLVACNLATLAAVDARRGRSAACRERTERAARIARDLGEELVLAETRLALGHLALAEGRPEDAIVQLEPVARLARRNGVEEPSVLPHGPDLVEAYVRTGRLADAREELDRLSAQAGRTGRRFALAGAARCEGMLAADDVFWLWFRQALAQETSPFEHARTELEYGDRLRRINRRRDARPHLRAALEAFDDLEAAPWLDRAHAALRATGETVGRREPSGRERLTPQELQISLLVCEGRTNREIGATMFLSPKTVEFHLTRVYRKLDIHSRAELIRLLTREGAARV